MPGYTPMVLHKLQHKPTAHRQDSPHPWNKPVHCKHIQLITQKSSMPKLNSAETNRVQSVNGTFLYYARAIYPNILPAFNKISTCKFGTTQYTMDKLK